MVAAIDCDEHAGALRAVLGAAIRAVDAVPHAARELDDEASLAPTIVMDAVTAVDTRRPGRPRDIDYRGVTLRLF